MNDEERIRYDTILRVIEAELNPVLIKGDMNSCDEDEEPDELEAYKQACSNARAVAIKGIELLGKEARNETGR